MLGQLLLELRREEEVVDSFRKAIEIDPSYPPAHMALAQLFLTRGEVDLALTHYRKAAEKLEPPTNKAMPYANLAGAYQSQGKWDEAFASYKKAIELDPKNVSLPRWSGIHSSRKAARSARRRVSCLVSIARTAYDCASRWQTASSAEFVGELRLGEGTQPMIQRDFHAAQRLEAVRLVHGQFRVVVQALHTPG